MARKSCKTFKRLKLFIKIFVSDVVTGTLKARVKERVCNGFGG